MLTELDVVTDAPLTVSVIVHVALPVDSLLVPFNEAENVVEEDVGASAEIDGPLPWNTVQAYVYDPEPLIAVAIHEFV